MLSRDAQFKKWMKERLKTESVDRGVERTIFIFTRMGKREQYNIQQIFY